MKQKRACREPREAAEIGFTRHLMKTLRLKRQHVIELCTSTIAVQTKLDYMTMLLFNKLGQW